MEEKTIKLHRALLISLKVIPMLLAMTALLNTTFSYFDIESEYLSYIMAALVLAFLYIASYAFRFCEYHRMFLHYFVINLILNTWDYYWGIPVSDKGLFLLYMSITGISLFVILYLYLKSRRNNGTLVDNKLID
jgi:hypothetical protein